jgi:hypothetical protein
MIGWCLGVLCVVLTLLLWRTSVANRRLRSELDSLTARLEEATRRLAEIETSAKSGDLFQKAVAILVGLGVPGLVLLVIMATTGFAGAAAITTALAALGGPFGMLGGITALVAMGITSKALARYGYPKIAEAVVRGLVAKGESKESIRRTLDSIPHWIVSTEVRSKVLGTL